MTFSVAVWQGAAQHRLPGFLIPDTGVDAPDSNQGALGSRPAGGGRLLVVNKCVPRRIWVAADFVTLHPTA